MELPKVLIAALRWPTFLFSVFCLYWSVTIFGLNHRLEWLNLTRKRNDVLGWSKGMKEIHKFTVLKVGTEQLCREKCMYLCNHRSWADFMVDQYVTEGRSLFLSRWAVLFVFPQFMSGIRAMRAVILFKRGKIADKEGFNRRIDKEFDASPQTGLAIYPEGHRSTDGESLPLKRGMLHYAFSRRLPVQVVIGANKEAILSEKHQTARFRQTVAVGYSNVIMPSSFDNFDDFMAKIQAVWDETWNRVFSANWERLPVLPEVNPRFDYPRDIVIKMFIICLSNIVLGVVAAYYWWLAACLVFAAMGPLQYPVLGALVVYIATAFYVYSQPVDALTVHQRMLKQMHSQSAVVCQEDVKKKS